MKPLHALVLSAWLALLAAAPGVVLADDAADVQRLQAAGQSEQALQRVDTLLVAKPKDPQLRFLRGVLLAERRRTAEALEVFRRLSEEFPELPEPYNNAAALYAAQGDYDQAKVALEHAVRANPSFATAHENLGDVLAMLASQSYARALQLDPRNTELGVKLALVRQLANPPARSALVNGSPVP
jgi:Flp pilus assembly protein TadD